VNDVPDTSLVAYAATRDRRVKHVHLVLLALKEGKGDAVDVQMRLGSYGITMNIYEVRRRISDLHKQSRIYDSGERQPSGENGRPMIVWRVVKAAPQMELF